MSQVPTNIFTKFALTTLAAILLSVVMISGSPRTEAAATSYQNPCAPWSVSGYNFGQWVSGWGYHSGVDTACAAGAAVYSVAEGTVVYSARTPDSYRWGNLILIEHTNPDGSKAVSLYGHLGDNRQVSAGQNVAKGQQIGSIGAAWSAANGNWGDHLHFGIHLGAYGAGAGTYAAWVRGYESANPVTVGWVNPTDYMSGRRVTYDYQVVSVTGQGAYGKTAEYYVDFNLRNTGTTTWNINGANAIKLGTIRATDRPSGFSTGMVGQGWSSANRIALMADTPPGGVGTFRARFNNKNVPTGLYTEYFAPVIDGVTWFADKGLGTSIYVQPPQITAQFAGQGFFGTVSPTFTQQPSDASYLLPGQVTNLKFFVRNTGDVPWSKNGPNPVRLATSNPRDRGSSFATGGNGAIPSSENWPAYNRPSDIDGRLDIPTGTVLPADVINPGETAVFSFAVTVPDQPGEYREYFQPVMEGVTWMNELGMWYRLRVLPPGHHYEYAGQENPAAVPMGGGGTSGAVYLRNTGQSNWPVGGNVRLGTDRAQDRASEFRGSDWLAPNRASTIDQNTTTPGATTIGPGQVAKFSFTVNNPARTDGQYPEYFKPLVEGQAWMPENYGIYVPVTVQSPALQYEYVTQSFDKPLGTLRAGDTVNALIGLKNTGTTVWQSGGANPVRLATSRPNDRASLFTTLTGTDPWLAINRASGIDGELTSLNPLTVTPTNGVAQGEIAVFKVPFTVPAATTPGNYNEYLNLVQEGVSWLPDKNLYLPLTVLP